MYRTGARMTQDQLDEARRAYLASGGTVTQCPPAHVEPLRIGTKFNPAVAGRRTHIEARVREEYPSCASVAKLARSLGMGKMALIATAYELGVTKC